MNLDPEALGREIEDALEELDRLEAEVVELFGELLGPEARRQVAEYMRAKERDPKTEVLRRLDGAKGLPKKGVTPGPWTVRPAIP